MESMTLEDWLIQTPGLIYEATPVGRTKQDELKVMIKPTGENHPILLIAVSGNSCRVIRQYKEK